MAKAIPASNPLLSELRFHRKGAKDAKIKASLAELTEVTERESFLFVPGRDKQKASFYEPLGYLPAYRQAGVSSSEALHRPGFRGIQGEAGERSSWFCLIRIYPTLEKAAADLNVQ